MSSVAGSSKSRGRVGEAKSSEKVKVTKAQPKLIPLPFLDDETPASEDLARSRKGTTPRKSELMTVNTEGDLA